MNERGKGQPGEEGKPGEVGTREQGGRGGKGGTGGRGGDTTHVNIALVFIAILAIVLSAATIIVVRNVQSNNDKITKLQRQNAIEIRNRQEALLIANQDQDRAITLIRRTDYRLCLRQQIVRATLNLDQGHNDVGKPILPLYNCKPDLIGKPAILMTPAQTRAFTHYVQTNKHLP